MECERCGAKLGETIYYFRSRRVCEKCFKHLKEAKEYKEFFYDNVEKGPWS